MHYPRLDPVLIDLGALQIRWYGLMYVLAFVVCHVLATRRATIARGSPSGSPGFSRQDVSDLVFYGVLGVILGGRAGFVLFYGFDQLLADPLWLVRIWEGGMSFHGGLIGVCGALWLFAARRGRGLFEVTDFAAPLVPVGLGLGRLGNFINTELPGRVTDSALGVHFPCPAVGDLTLTCFGQYEAAARHVSSLYQAFTEGVVLFVLVWLFSARPRTAGAVSGVFLVGYGCLRFVTEFFREPDPHLGLVGFDVLSMGQLLSLPMVAFGILLLVPRAASR